MTKTLPRYSANPSNHEFYQNPYPIYQKMHALGPCFFWEEYGYVCFPGYQEVNAILRDRRFGREVTHVMDRKEAGLPDIPDHLKSFYDFEANSMLEREPPVHTRLRRLVNRAFVSRHIERLTPDLEALCDELIAEFPKNKPFDLLPAYCEKIPVLVIADLLGVPRTMADQLLDWSHKMVAMYQFNRSREIENAAVKATAEFDAYIRHLAELRRSSPKDDLLTGLVEAQSAGDSLSMDELVTTAILLLNAGHEATVHAIGNSLKTLLENEIDTAALFAEKKSQDGAIEELLRFDPPLHLFTRFVLEDLEFAGVQLKKGQTIGLLLGAANHDEARYANAHQLDFTRGGEGHTSFGAGIHFCLGAPLARLEMAIALPAIFKKCPELKLAEKPVYSDRYHFHGLEKLMISVR
ncbi:MAG: cytochrome P450 [Salaquimonas sp.]